MLIPKKLLPQICNKILEIKSQIKFYINLKNDLIFFI